MIKTRDSEAPFYTLHGNLQKKMNKVKAPIWQGKILRC